MCRNVQKDVEVTLLKNIMTCLSNENVVDNDTLLLYMHHYIQGIVHDVQPMYKHLIMYYVNKFIKHFEHDPINYILDKKLYSLMQYYSLNTSDVQVKYGSINLLKYYRDEITNKYYSNDPVTKNLYHLNLLGVACVYNQLESVQYLRKYLDIDEPNLWNCTPLLIAVYCGSFQIVKWLINQGADINIKHICGSSLLYCAIEKYHFNIAHYLINKGVIVDSGIVKACINFTSDSKGAKQILKRVLKLVSKEDFIKPNTQFCYNSTDVCDKATGLICFCKKCRLVNNHCPGKSWTFLQGACYLQKFDTVLQLLSYDAELAVNQQPETCIHLQKHLEDDEYKTRKKDDILFKFDTLNSYLFEHINVCRKPTECCFYFDRCICGELSTPVAEYIWKLIQRRDKVSYKHQRKILDKMYENKKITSTVQHNPSFLIWR
jgi:hypothetical protein